MVRGRARHESALDETFHSGRVDIGQRAKVTERERLQGGIHILRSPKLGVI